MNRMVYWVVILMMRYIYDIVLINLNQSMFTLYQKFLQQVKDEDIKKYNDKHRNYLIRAGKLKENTVDINQKNQNRTHNQKQKRGFEKQKQEQFAVNRPQTAFTDDVIEMEERPLKGMQNYDVPTDHQFQSFPKMDKRIDKAVEHERKISVKTKNQTPVVQKQSQIIEKPIPVQKLVGQQRQKPVDMNQLSEFPDEEEVILVECPQGCGRKFNEKAIQKHIKICQKGEKKRKVFKVKVVDEEAQQLKKDEPKEEVKKNVPKWKKESNQLRKAICTQPQSGKPGESKVVQEEVDDRVECPGCGRKFNADPAKKHIPGCVQRNKGKGK